MMFVQNSRKRYWLLFLCISLLLISSSVYRLSAGDPCTDTCYVDAVNGNDANGGASPADAKATIQAAVDQVDDGGTVIVAAGTYVENVVITKNVTINGADQTTTIVDGNAAGSVFEIDLHSTVTLVLTNLTITNGNSQGSVWRGGGVDAGWYGNITIENSTITGNTADRGGGVNDSEGELYLTNVQITNNTATIAGGGIYNWEHMVVTDSTISGNTAPEGAGVSQEGHFVAASITNSHIDNNVGDGVYTGQNNNMPFTISGGTISNNTGRGIYSTGDALVVDGVTIAMNGGDGIYADGQYATVQNSIITENGNRGIVVSGAEGGEFPHIIEIINCQITNNQGRGVVAQARASFLLSYSTVSGNQDGGVEASGRGGGGGVSYSTISGNTTTGSGGGALARGLGSMSIRYSTISGNHADEYGGGFANDGGLGASIENSTISGNTATIGGGIYNNNSTHSDLSNVVAMRVNFITVTDNTADSGAGIFLGGAETAVMSVRNSIIATNNGDNCDSINALTIEGENISDDATCGFGAGDNANANLGPLQNNGGVTLTHAPASTSDAIDIVTTCTDLNDNPLTIDQRDFSRPIGSHCDAGAVEDTLQCNTICYVDAVNGNDANGGTSPADAKATIQAAVDQVDDGGTVIVAAGTYVENVVITKNVTINGADQTTTIVDGNAAGSVFYIGFSYSDPAAYDITVVLTDLTITNGNSLGLLWRGGGVDAGYYASITIENSTITGNTADRGGGVNGSEGELYLTNVQITDNTATIAGGGIYNWEHMVVTDSTISGNSAPEGAGVSQEGHFVEASITNSHIDGNIGDGVYTGQNNNMPFTISGGTISNNTGRGIYSTGDALVVDGVTVAMNGGDGIYSDGRYATVQNSIVTENGNRGIVVSGSHFGEACHGIGIINSQITNHPGRGVVAQAWACFSLSYSTVSGNQDGGIAAFGGSGQGGGSISYSTISGNTTTGSGGGALASRAGMSFHFSTISDNHADQYGGGFASDVGLGGYIENSTFSGNTAVYGGGIFSGDSMHPSFPNFPTPSTLLNFVTITDNTADYGAGVFNGQYSTGLAVRNSIIATNHGDNCSWDDPVANEGGNVSDDGTCGFGSGNNVNADLGPLQDNGGATLTHAPAPTSDAIEIADVCTALNDNPLTIDQRGFPRPVGSHCDAGAVEIADPPLHPRIEITKTPDRIRVLDTGENVVFTVEIRSVGDIPAIVTHLTDSVFGEQGHTCQPALPTTIDVGDSITCTFTGFVEGHAFRLHRNIITATGEDVYAEAVAHIAIRDIYTDIPGLLLVTHTATPDMLQEPGGPVRFDIFIQNLTSSPGLYITRVTHSWLGDITDYCTGPRYDFSDRGDLPVWVEIGLGVNCTITRTLDRPPGTYEFSVEVFATDDLGYSLLPRPTASTTVTITPIEPPQLPRIEITKTPDRISVPETGEDVVFSVEIRSVGDAPATVTHLTDSVFGEQGHTCQPALPTTINIGDSITCTFTGFVQGPAHSVHENTITAVGYDVQAEATAQVSIQDIPASLSASHTAAPNTLQEPGGMVTFNIDITNTSAVDLVWVNRVQQSWLGDVTTCDHPLPKQLGIGESLHCTVSGELLRPVGSHDFSVEVFATDDDGNDVYTTAQTTVSITAPPPPVCNPSPAADLRHSQSHLNAPFDNGTVVNLSDACTYDIGIASYSVMDGSVGTQQLLGSQTASIGPGETLNLGPVPVNTCTTQVDLFYGGVITDFSGGARYGDRLIDVRWLEGTGLCGEPEPPPPPPPPVCNPNPAADLRHSQSHLNAPFDNGTVVNLSDACTYDIGIASYSVMDGTVATQQLLGSQTASIGPGETLNLGPVPINTCTTQVDLFYGGLITDFSGGARYGDRLIDVRWLEGTGLCGEPVDDPPDEPQQNAPPVESTTEPVSEVDSANIDSEPVEQPAVETTVEPAPNGGTGESGG